MVVDAFTVRWASRLVSAMCAVAVATYAAYGADLSAGFWGAVWGCVSRVAGMLPWWAGMAYGLVAAMRLLVSGALWKLLWGMPISDSGPGRVTLADIALWVVFIPADIVILFVAWPFMLGRVTLILMRTTK